MLKNVSLSESVKTEQAPIEIQSFKQKAACFWSIKESPKGIIARSDMGDTFEGTIKEFNRRLKA
jgi:hypothetical protein